MIRLIINADDLGAGEETDRGILECFQKGGITSASLLANGPSFRHAVEGARRNRLPVGVHLNLSEGKSATGPLPGLTDAEGRFQGKTHLRRLLQESPPPAAALFRELSAQVDKVREAGIVPDHLDTHQHFFLFPAGRQSVLEVAAAFGIGALRLPIPAEDEKTDPPHLQGELALYRRLSPKTARDVNSCAILTPDALLGMPFLNRLDENRLLALLENLSEGTWELMVHPGYADPANPFSSPERTVEICALLSQRVQDILRLRGIRLVSFGDLA